MKVSNIKPKAPVESTTIDPELYWDKAIIEWTQTLSIILSVFVFVLGTIFGSFYNVVIYRMPRKISVLKGRSFCPTCKHQLKAIDLTPVLSWFMLKGRCRYCSSKIDFRYPFIEFLSGVIFVWSLIHFKLSFNFALHIIFWSMLLIVAYIDYDHMIVLDKMLLFFSGISAIIIAIIHFQAVKLNPDGPSFIKLFSNNILGAAVGFAIYLAIYLIAKAIYKKEAFGQGDVTFMAAIGLVLGLKNTIAASILAFFIAVILIVFIKLFKKAFNLKEEMPFGPPMAISAFIVSLYGEQIINFYLNIVS